MNKVKEKYPKTYEILNQYIKVINSLPNQYKKKYYKLLKESLKELI